MTRIRAEQITSGSATDGHVLTADGAGNVAWEAPAAGAAPMGPELIEEQVLAAPAASVTFSSIPQTYRHLQLYVVARGTTTMGATAVRVHVNGDTGINYQFHILQANGVVSSVIESHANNYLAVGSVSDNGSPEGQTGYARAEFLYYRAAQFKYVTTESHRQTLDAIQYSRWGALTWMNTAPITSLTISPDAETWTAGSLFALYGVR